MNIDLKILQNWLKANEITLNAGKTEFILFRHPNKKVDYDLKFKLMGKDYILPNTLSIWALQLIAFKLAFSLQCFIYKVMQSQWNVIQY